MRQRARVRLHVLPGSPPRTGAHMTAYVSVSHDRISPELREGIKRERLKSMTSYDVVAE
ncbi:hypothetical protein NSZ01_25500 [Nocardioides szechwanensis]|nr:hypothetical protein NSZ01_25500 [Nocardioides szechwanensis]